MFISRVDEQVKGGIQCGQAFVAPGGCLNMFFSVVEESEQVVGASGKQFHVIRDGRELGYGVQPAALGADIEPVHKQGEG